MKSCFFVLQYILFPFVLLAQVNTDSLENLLSTVSESKKFEIHDQLARAYKDSSMTKSIENATFALNFAKKYLNKDHQLDSYQLLADILMHHQQFDRAIIAYSHVIEIGNRLKNMVKVAWCYNRIGIIREKQTRYDDALAMYQKSLKIRKELGDKRDIAITINNIGNIYWYKNNFEEALKHYIQSLAIKEELGDKLAISNALNNIASLYFQQHDFDEALKYNFRSLKIKREIGDLEGIAINLSAIGMIYENKKSYQEAIDYNTQSLAVCRKIGYKLGESAVLINIGNVYNAMKESRKALESFLAAIEIAKEIDDKLSITICLNLIGNTYMNLKEMGQAHEYLEHASQEAESIQGKQYLMISHLYLSNYYSEKKDYLNALNYYKQYAAIKDSIFNEEKSKQLAEIHTKYETEKKETENTMLKAKIDIQDMQRNRIITIALAIVLSVISVTFFLSNQQKKKSNIILQRRNSVIQRQNEKLEHINKEKNSIIGVVSHNLKAPLNRIQGLVQLIKLKQDNLTDEQKYYLEKVDTVISEGSAIVQNLLDIRAIEEQRINFIPEEINMEELLQYLVNEYKIQADKKNIRLHINNKANDVTLISDKLNLLRIFDNLLSNAIKFSYQNGNVFMKISDCDKNIRVEVQDEGPGITTEDQKNLFKKYQRLRARPTGGESSTGLGLSIVKTFAERLNGRVWYADVEGAGARFVVELPRV